MIKRIIFWFFFICLMLALVLHFKGVERIGFTTGYTSFLRDLNYNFKDFENVRIPDIPYIPRFDSSEWYLVVLNLLFDYFNIMISVMNVVDEIINILIQLIMFIAAIIETLFSAPGYFTE